MWQVKNLIYKNLIYKFSLIHLPQHTARVKTSKYSRTRWHWEENKDTTFPIYFSPNPHSINTHLNHFIFQIKLCPIISFRQAPLVAQPCVPRLQSTWTLHGMLIIIIIIFFFSFILFYWCTSSPVGAPFTELFDWFWVPFVGLSNAKLRSWTHAR